MASVASAPGTSPLSSDYNLDPEDEQAFWAAVHTTIGDGTSPSPVGTGAGGGSFMTSPASLSNSLGSSWAMLGQTSIGGPVSPINSHEQLSQGQGSSYSGSYVDLGGEFLGAQVGDGLGQMGGMGTVGNMGGGFMFDTDFGLYNSAFAGVIPVLEQQQHQHQQQSFLGMEGLGEINFDTSAQSGPWEPFNLRAGHTTQTVITTTPELINRPTITTGPPNNNNNLVTSANSSPGIFVIEDPSFDFETVSPSPPSYIEYTPSLSPPASTPPKSPGMVIRWEQGVVVPEQQQPKSAPIPVRKSNKGPSGSAGNSYRVTKRKASPTDSMSSSTLSARLAASQGQLQTAKGKSKSPSPTPSSSGSTSGQAKFLIVTPSTINAHAQSQSTNPNQQSNPFECFEALRPSQRGRKGPLATDTKQSALQVRRKGACFCCHARKVKCDMERPCRNCVKLTHQVPQAVCWQFPDFMPVLFPDFIRRHFRKEEITQFIETNVSSFTLDGVERPCTVELFSGLGLSARLQIKAKFFTPRSLSADVLRHYHLQTGHNTVDLQARGSAPIGLDVKATTGAQREELKRKIKEYIASIVSEPEYASLVTSNLRHTDIPRKILSIIHTYAHKTDSAIVKRALAIYAMHFVLTRHLCLTPNSITSLSPLLPPLDPSNPWVTPRLLNRQLKALIDDILTREMQLLFESFSKSLKPKLRKEWAPCLAAFLVLCLFMESVETAADNFVISDNEISLRNGERPTLKRGFALGVNREIEQLPFRQFGIMFHMVYQTYSREVSQRSFNPLEEGWVDEANKVEDKLLGREEEEMVRGLRRLMSLEDYDAWSELDFLTADPILPNVEEHPYPRDVGFNYTGRLVAKFLLSFQQEKYIIGESP
ncbi:hypothetical protein QC762_706170 [Podospora pseudocomata]|uniref:Zn(2)-C6 fungal-type domain-containing protein n=1 Tax=Podospora pseudocomata TaxID=2093779 RepID=A0ABR0G3I0_9PEZI|nr:hypothetical protein QC762_706170 [Podospora pseudocomata]